MQVRLHRKADHAAIEALAVHVCEEDWPGYPVEDARNKLWLVDEVYVAEDKCIVGIMGVKKCEPYKVLEVHYLNIEKAHRHKGVGRALLKKAEERAKELGKQVVRVYTSANEAIASKFYEACGFKESGTVKNYEYKGDEAVFYTKVVR